MYLKYDTHQTAPLQINKINPQFKPEIIVTRNSDGPVIKTIANRHVNFNARGTGIAVNELLYSQICCIQ
jgi:hypothetical protein